MPGGSCSQFAPQRQPRSWRSAVKTFRKSCIRRLYREHPWDRRTGCRNLFQSTVSICSERTAFQRKEQTAPEGSLQRRAIPHIHAADMRRRACSKYSRPRFICGIPPCIGVWPSFACMRSDRTSQTASRSICTSIVQRGHPDERQFRYIKPRVPARQSRTLGLLSCI